MPLGSVWTSQTFHSLLLFKNKSPELCFGVNKRFLPACTDVTVTCTIVALVHVRKCTVASPQDGRKTQIIVLLMWRLQMLMLDLTQICTTYSSGNFCHERHSWSPHWKQKLVFRSVLLILISKANWLSTCYQFLRCLTIFKCKGAYARLVQKWNIVVERVLPIKFGSSTTMQWLVQPR